MYAKCSALLTAASRDAILWSGVIGADVAFPQPENDNVTTPLKLIIILIK